MSRARAKTPGALNILVLDGHTLNPGDLSWAPLAAQGDCTVYDRTSPDDIISRSQNAHIVITNKACLSREIILALPTLKYIGVTATGYNIVDATNALSRMCEPSWKANRRTWSMLEGVFLSLVKPRNTV